jgi:hypothetical protein
MYHTDRTHESNETFEAPRFKRGQRVFVTENYYRNHTRIDHLVGELVTITGRSWERGAYWYAITTDSGDRFAGLRFGDFRALSK